MKEFIFNNRDIIKLELAANTILDNLLDKFATAVLYYDEKYKSKHYPEVQSYKKLYSLISDNYCENYKFALNEGKPINGEQTTNRIMNEDVQYDIYLRLLLVVDYISGMTDSYAKSLYQELNGSGLY